MALTDSLVSYWKLDESSGNAADAKGSNTLTNNGTTAYASGKINNGIDFESSSSQYLSITDASQSGLDITGDLSISMWVKLESAPGTDAQFMVINKWLSTGNQRSFNVEYDDEAGTKKLYFQVSSSGGAPGTTFHNTTTLNTGTFYHLAFVYTAATPTMAIYVNATDGAVSDAATSTSIFNGTGDFQIGARQGTGPFFDGIIDEVGIWSRALTSAEVSQLHNNGNGLPYPLTVATAPSASLLTLNAG